MIQPAIGAFKVPIKYHFINLYDEKADKTGSARVFGNTVNRGFLNRVYGILSLNTGIRYITFLNCLALVFLLITQYIYALHKQE